MKRLLPVICLFSCFTAAHSFAGSSTWSLNPISSDWNTPDNWTTAVVPTDTATFGVSNITGVTVSQDLTEVRRIVFDSSASAYTITALPDTSLIVSGAGLVNRSQVDQTFLLGEESGEIIISESASADAHIVFTTNSPGLQFQADSSAGAALINNQGGTATSEGGFVGFYERSKATQAGINNYGGEVRGARGGWAYFTENSSAGTAHINCYGATVNGALGGLVQFINENTHAGSAKIVATGGTNGGGPGVIQFLSRSVGESCRVLLSGDGTLDVSSHGPGPNLAIGSLESNGLGGGIVTLGSNQLTVGTNNLGTLFYGLIQEGPGGSGGSLRKVGTGTLLLLQESTYSGGTIIDGGTIKVNGDVSPTGSGAVQVNTGTLGGNGVIAGPVTIGGPESQGAILDPALGDRTLQTLTIQGPLRLTSHSTLHLTFLGNSGSGTDRVMANGVTIDGDAQLSWEPRGNHRRRLEVGTVATLIINTAPTPIIGTFPGLSDGRIVRMGVNKFQANYSGGDGNDLTLTVVP